MDNLQGRILSVSTEVQGSIAVSWAGNTMSVTNAADFSRAGGFFTFDNGATVYQYTEVIESEDPDYPDAVTTVQAAPDNFEAETLAAIYPPAVDVYAELALDDSGDSLTVEVPHNLRALLVDGIREPEQQESALAQFVEGRWILADVTGELATIPTSVIDGLDEQLEAMEDAREADKAENDQALADAKTELTEAFTQAVGDVRVIANGKNRTYWSAALPGDTEGIAGDTWFVVDEAGAVTELWKHDGATWSRSHIDGVALVAESVTAAQIAADAITADKIAADAVTADNIVANAITANKINSDEAFANLVSANIANFAEVWAGKITANSLAADAVNGKTLSGVDIYSPSATALPRVHVGGSMVEVTRATAEGVEYSALSIGGPDADKVTVTDSNGAVLAGLLPSGDVVGKTISAETDVVIGGNSVSAILNSLPKGVIATLRMTAGTQYNTRAGSTEVGIAEIYFSTASARAVEVKFSGLVTGTINATTTWRLRMTSASGATPAAPLTSSSQIQQATLVISANAGFTGLNISTILTTAPNTNYRILLTALGVTPGSTCGLLVSPAYPGTLSATDLGSRTSTTDGVQSNGGATPVSGTSVAPISAPTDVPYTTTWTADWVQEMVESAPVGGTLSLFNSPTGFRSGTINGRTVYTYIGFNTASGKGDRAGARLVDTLAGMKITEAALLLTNEYLNPPESVKFTSHYVTKKPTAALDPSDTIQSGYVYPYVGIVPGTAVWFRLDPKDRALLSQAKVNAFVLGYPLGSIDGADASDRHGYGAWKNTLSNIQLKVSYTIPSQSGTP